MDEGAKWFQYTTLMLSAGKKYLSLRKMIFSTFNVILTEILELYNVTSFMELGPKLTL